MLNNAVQRPFRFDNVTRHGLYGRLDDACLRLLESLSGLSALDGIYHRNDWPQSPRAFCDKLLQLFGIEYRVAPAQLDHILRTGGAIVVANHPFGALDGIIAAHILTGIRTDVRILVNYHFARIPELQGLFITVDPYGGDQARQRNRQPLRWVQDGGLLLLFPAGEVAHLSLQHRGVREAPWNNSLARLVRLTRATVVPMHFTGRKTWSSSYWVCCTGGCAPSCCRANSSTR